MPTSGPGEYGLSLYLPLNFIVNLKLPEKSSKKKRAGGLSAYNQISIFVLKVRLEEPSFS